MNRHEFDRKQHWQEVYRTRAAEETSWFQALPGLSLEMIAHTGLGPAASLIDIGGGTSRLVDCLLDLGYDDLTVLDISAEALSQASLRLGSRAGQVNWIEQDATRFVPARQYDLWHDRAAFHFLTEPEDRQRYRAVLRKALTPGGQVILATFAPGGPLKCSGLDIIQYDAAKLAGEFGPEFTLLEQREEKHATPAGREQLFNFFRFRNDA